MATTAAHGGGGETSLNAILNPQASNVNSGVSTTNSGKLTSPSKVDCRRSLTPAERERMLNKRRKDFKSRLEDFTKKGGAVASFSGMSLDERQVQSAINGVLNSQKVTVLNFDGLERCVGDGNIGGVASVISSWAKVHLKEVTLAACVIGPKGCKQVAEAMLHNPHINFLSLKDNDVTGAGTDFSGIAALARVLTHGDTKDCEASCYSLQRLDLSGNALADRGLSELLPIVRTNSSIYQFNLARNLLGEVAGENLLEALKIAGRSTRMCHMELHGNLFPLEIASKLRRTLEANMGKKFLSERLAKAKLTQLRQGDMHAPGSPSSSP